MNYPEGISATNWQKLISLHNDVDVTCTEWGLLFESYLEGHEEVSITFAELEKIQNWLNHPLRYS